MVAPSLPLPPQAPADRIAQALYYSGLLLNVSPWATLQQARAHQHLSSQSAGVSCIMVPSVCIGHRPCCCLRDRLWSS